MCCREFSVTIPRMFETRSAADQPLIPSAKSDGASSRISTDLIRRITHSLMRPTLAEGGLIRLLIGQYLQIGVSRRTPTVKLNHNQAPICWGS